LQTQILPDGLPGRRMADIGPTHQNNVEAWDGQFLSETQPETRLETSEVRKNYWGKPSPREEEPLNVLGQGERVESFLKILGDLQSLEERKTLLELASTEEKRRCKRRVWAMQQFEIFWKKVYL